MCAVMSGSSYIFAPIRATMSWKRSDSVPVPTVWSEFVSKTNRKYWIQDIPQDYKDVIASYMVYAFCKEEPLCKYSCASLYANFLKYGWKFWRNCLDQDVGLVCFTKDDDGDWRIAGMNCTVVATRDEKHEQVEDKRMLKLISALDYVTKEADAFEVLKTDKYLSAMGLFVLPEFRGEGIGLELLKAREPLCKALGIKGSCTVFTSAFSQVIARKVGFQELVDIPYTDLRKKNPLFDFPGIEQHTPNIKVMYMKY